MEVMTAVVDGHTAASLKVDALVEVTMGPRAPMNVGRRLLVELQGHEPVGQDLRYEKGAALLSVVSALRPHISESVIRNAQHRYKL